LFGDEGPREGIDGALASGVAESFLLDGDDAISSR